MATRERIFKYCMTCDTENKKFYSWAYQPPTACPSSGAHTVDANKTVIEDSMFDDQFNNSAVRIVEDDSGTKTSFRTEGFQIDIAGGEEKNTPMVFKYAIGVLAIKFTSSAVQRGDVISVNIAPPSAIGATTVTTPLLATVVYVSPTVIQNIRIGYRILFQVGASTTYDMGEVIVVHPNRVVVDTAAAQEVPAGTPVKILVPAIKNYILDEPAAHVVGDSKVGSSIIPAYSQILISYKNNSEVTAKKFVYNLEYVY